jgi:hypothetical protein
MNWHQAQENKKNKFPTKMHKRMMTMILRKVRDGRLRSYNPP